MKYNTWVRFNVQGKQVWGDVFPDGTVPVQNISTQHATLAGFKDVESVFTVNWKELTANQQQAIIEKLSKQSGASPNTLLKDITKRGLPLRRSLAASCGTSQFELYFNGGILS